MSAYRRKDAEPNRVPLNPSARTAIAMIIIVPRQPERPVKLLYSITPWDLIKLGGIATVAKILRPFNDSRRKAHSHINSNSHDHAFAQYPSEPF
jgi:hypothetical protein